MYLEVSEFLREPAPGGKDNDDGDGDDKPGGTYNDDGDRACTWWRNSEGMSSPSWTSRRQKVGGLQPWIFLIEWIICRSF